MVTSTTYQSGTAHDYLVKLLVIGDSGVGKSCLLLRYSGEAFSGEFMSTIGIDFKIKTTMVDGKKVKLQIWDTAGQERFRNITSAYYRGSMGILLVYDVVDRKSFNNVSNWMRQIELNAAADVNVTLVGNKCDMGDDARVVSFEQGQALAASHGPDVRFIETSARTNTNVKEAFDGLAADVVKRLESKDRAAIAGMPTITVSPEQPKTKFQECC